jgi:type I restriction enzyme S subunit
VKAGWEVKPLGEAFKTVTGNTPPKGQAHLYGTDIPLVKPPELLDGEVNEASDGLTLDGADVARVAPTGSILVSCIGNLGKVGLAMRPLAFNQQINAIYPNPSIAEPKFTFYQALSPQFREQLDALSGGTTVAIVNKSRFNSIEVPLPPLEEQQRIVAILDEAFEGLARARTHAETNLQNARELFEAMLHQYFSGVTANWRAMTVEESLTKTKVPNKIQRKSYLDAGQFPIVSQETGLINGYWDDDADLVRIKRPVVVFGDHTRILKFVDFDFVVGADGTQIMAPRHEFDPRFYYFALKTIDLKGKGYARHFSHLKKCTIRFPKDISQQQEIADRLDTLSEHSKMLAAEYSTKSKELDALRQSLLQKAFAGELT